MNSRRAPHRLFLGGLRPWLLALLTIGLCSIPADASPFVYVANFNSSSVSVIDVATNTVAATVQLGFRPGGLAVSPDGLLVYVSDFDSNTVRVITTATNTLLPCMISVGSGPGALAVSPRTVFSDQNVLHLEEDVWVANPGSTGFGNTVSVITNRRPSSGTVGVGVNPSGLAVTPDGSRVYVANRFSQTVSVINRQVGVTTISDPSFAEPVDVAITPDGTVPM